MPAAPVDSPKGSSSSVVSAGDFERLCSTVPDSQPYVSKHFDDSQIKKFSATQDEISETALGEGFSFGIKRPPRPGQFSERPFRQPSEASKQIQTSPRASELQQHSSSPARTTNAPTAAPRGLALSLHELSLPASQLVSTPPPRPNFRPSNSPDAKPAKPFHSVDVDIPSRQPSHRLPSEVPESQGLGLQVASASANKHQKEGGGNLLHDPFPEGATEAASLGSLPSKESRGTTRIIAGPSSTVPNGNTTRHESAAPVFANNLHLQENLASFKIPEKHLARTDHIRRRPSPGSACGDLEGPVQRSPYMQRNTMVNRPAVSHDSPDWGSATRHRSRSRTSNISRKRSTIRKDRSHRDPDRKKTAMHQVAQYWNECIQIAEEEKNQANWEIERLQHELRRHQLKLTESRSMLDDKVRELHDIQHRHQQLEETDSQNTSENRRLGNEIEELRDQLCESKTRATALEEKHRQYRLKLNEAIKEQQALFLRSRAFYEESLSELRKENEKRVTDSNLIDKALEDSGQKREEMKRCLEEFRGEMERESRLNALEDQTISNLRSHAKEQEETLIHERDVTESLRRQLKAQEGTQKAVQDMAAKVETLLDICVKKDQEQKENTNMMGQIHTRLDAMTQRVLKVETNAVSSTAIERAVQRIEETISTQIVAAITDVASNQHLAEQTTFKLAVACAGQLTEIRRTLGSQDDRIATAQAMEGEVTRKFEDCFENLTRNMEKAQQSCQQTKQAIETWIETESHSRRGSNETREAGLDEKLAQRGEEISQLEQKLQLVSEAYTAKIKSLTADLSRNDEAAKNELRNVVVGFQNNLDQGFRQEKERSERNLRHSQTAIAALESQLKAVNNHLAVAKFGPSQESNLDQTNIGEDQALVSQLQQKVNDFERQAKATKELRDRWQRDIKTVDALRGQLRDIQERMPQMERFDATLGKVAEVNKLVCSTAQYLVRERGWVQQLHEEAVQHSSSHDDAPHSEDEEKPNAAEELGEAKAVSDTVSAGVKSEAIASQKNVDEALTEFSALDSSFKRKVEVHSPKPEGEVKSPLPPLSIREEQIQRRGAAQPRSILKLSSSQESTTIEEQTARMTLGQNQYNRPVMGGITAAASANMVEAIRSGLVPSERPNPAWSLPSVADFERDSQLASVNSSQDAAGSGKRRLECPDEVPEMARKKSKLERNGISVSVAYS
ncbi:Uncharacterized protein TPAR_08304 [Tolypocladium paradoxum]|uniref:Uncharacterized protein n=1 Tax=Tolypocladium paradoxum TaxID=94208 RepID=A0A2S4KMV4_9HYPO|nr:Uncharacterized protein TPAR_08304 [Tolypocladium paradoxum]